MSYKFQMTWTMNVKGRLKTHNLQVPLTVVFNIYRKSLETTNVSNFKIYNLGQNMRDDLKRDPTFAPDLQPLRRLEFWAGYASKGYESMIFSGEVYKCFSYREGPDIITEIESYDGLQAIQRTQVEQTYSKGANSEAIYREMIGLLGEHGIKLGALGRIKGLIDTSTRGVVFNGSVWNALKKSIGNLGFICIDQGKVYILSEDECIFAPGNLQRIDASVGLLHTPKRNSSMIDLDMIFEPNLTLLQKIEVVSTVNPDVNGIFVINSLCHHGTISDGVRSSVTTSVCGSNPQGTPKVVTPI